MWRIYKLYSRTFCQLDLLSKGALYVHPQSKLNRCNKNHSLWTRNIAPNFHIWKKMFHKRRFFFPHTEQPSLYIHTQWSKPTIKHKITLTFNKSAVRFWKPKIKKKEKKRKASKSIWLEHTWNGRQWARTSLVCATSCHSWPISLSKTVQGESKAVR